MNWSKELSACVANPPNRKTKSLHRHSFENRMVLVLIETSTGVELNQRLIPKRSFVHRHKIAQGKGSLTCLHARGLNRIVAGNYDRYALLLQKQVKLSRSIGFLHYFDVSCLWARTQDRLQIGHHTCSQARVEVRVV